MAAVANGADGARHERALLGAACGGGGGVPVLGAGQGASVQARAAGGCGAAGAVTEALSSAGDNAPSGPAVSSVGPAAVSSV